MEFQISEVQPRHGSVTSQASVWKEAHEFSENFVVPRSSGEKVRSSRPGNPHTFSAYARVVRLNLEIARVRPDREGFGGRRDVGRFGPYRFDNLLRVGRRAADA